MLRQLWQRLSQSPKDNPLQRHVDRIESAIVACLVVGFLVAAPLLCLVAVRMAGAAAVREGQAESGWRPVTAVLQQSAAAGQIGGDVDASWVSARWRAPDGAWRHGLVAVELNAKAGQRMTVWVTPAGQLMHPPLTRADVLEWEVAGAMLALIGLAAVLVVAGGVVRVLANRRRMAGWARAWSATGPRWSSLR
ncbi:MAG TPA: hypothetical protein VMA73_30320 [Streptosporangiaceae bacterium]|nr:hypothetical protein [Streptosporangiaceae bacterium]